MPWTVLRSVSSDDGNVAWRRVYESDGEAEARAAFRRDLDTLRQGELRLVTPEGKVVALHRVTG